MENKLKIKQLLLSEDEDNWTLGVMLMIGNGVTVEDMMDELYPVEIMASDRVKAFNEFGKRIYHKGYCGYRRFNYELNVLRASSRYLLLINYKKLKNEISETTILDG